MDQYNTEQLRKYLEGALDGLGNAISVLEDDDDKQSQQPVQELRDARTAVGNILDNLSQGYTAKKGRDLNGFPALLCVSQRLSAPPRFSWQCHARLAFHNPNCLL